MVNVVKKQACPTCGQSCNVRQEVLSKNLIMALFRVANWAQENGIDKPVKRSEFAHLVAGTEANTANFAKLAWFAPQFFENINENGDKKKSYYHFDFKAIAEFFAGHTEIATVVLVDPLAPRQQRFQKMEFRRFNQIPSLVRFLDENHEFIVTYLTRANYSTQEITQGLLFDRF